MAVLIFLMFFAFQGFNPELTREEHMVMLTGHSSIGTIICMLLLIRITKRFVLKQPQPERNTENKFYWAAKLTHYALYTLMVLVPVTGLITANFHQLPVEAFGQISLNNIPNIELFERFKSLHLLAIYSLIVLLSLHITAALVHKFILRDQTMYKMRPWFK